ncbi:MAG: substrate-binding domain-containing protein [Eubacterium sp.]|nr:substrate-binding domain-containing protein [Eubacterium sp.]
MKKRRITVILAAAAMVVSLFAGTVAVSAEEDASFKVGFLDQSGEAPPVVRMREIIRDVVEAAGGELICDTSNEDSAEAQVNACEKLISADVKGIIMTPMADAILPAIINMCNENEVYLAITFRNIGDEDVKAVVEASPWYAGNCYEDEEAAGYNVMSAAFEKRPDMKKVALIALAVGDNTSDARVAGITKACEEHGASVVAEVRDIQQASDATDAVKNFVAANPDLDCVAVASCYENSAITALPEAIKGTGKTADEICIVSCDGGSDLTKLFDYGYAISVGGGHLEIDRGSTAVMLVNAIQGNPLGEPAHIAIPYMQFGSVEDVADYAVYVEGDTPIWTEEEIKDNLLISANPELSVDDVIGYIQGYSIQSLVERHKDIVEG